MFSETIRGVEVNVFAEDFEIVGPFVEPKQVYAETMDDEDFELTDEEVEILGIKAIEIFCQDDDCLD